MTEISHEKLYHQTKCSTTLKSKINAWLALSLGYGATSVQSVWLTGADFLWIAALAPPLIWLSVTDLEEQEIPDTAVLVVSVIGLLTTFSDGARSPLMTLGLGALVLLFSAIAGEVFWRRYGHEALRRRNACCRCCQLLDHVASCCKRGDCCDTFVDKTTIHWRSVWSLPRVFDIPDIPPFGKPAMTRRKHAKRNRRAGVTLLEIMVVLTIIALIAGLTAPRLMDSFGRAKSRTASLQMENLKGAVQLFYLDVGRYPSEAEGLDALITVPGDAENWQGPYLEGPKALRDPWENRYLYRSPAEDKPFEITTYGRDGRAGGTKEDSDISL
jgi:general secretion pathway protein G